MVLICLELFTLVGIGWFVQCLLFALNFWLDFNSLVFWRFFGFSGGVVILCLIVPNDFGLSV